MGKINVLDFQVANLIAAGEVVERPASAVKELLENSIDGGATDITVEIKRGGTEFIRVSDNGCGIAAEDLPVALKRHATSKISSASDLDRIMTLGFRGEALAAISSVSLTRMISKRREDASGTSITCEFGKVTDISPTGSRDGTTVIVENLFQNVPARRKFLKKDSSEAAAVISIVERIALSHPEIAIKMINNGNIEFRTQGDNKLFNSIYAVFGKEFSSKLIPVNSLSEGIEVYGYIGNPLNVRANRNYQNFFINGRYIRSKTATAALEQAYESYMEAGKYPCCVLFISIHPALVDVNVHPTKLEVKFSNEKVVFESIYCAVRNAILNNTDRPEVVFESGDMEDKDYSLYNAFVPVYDRISGEVKRDLTPGQMFDLPVTGTDGITGDTAYIPVSPEASPKPKSGQTVPLDIPVPEKDTPEKSGEETPENKSAENKSAENKSDISDAPDLNFSFIEESPEKTEEESKTDAPVKNRDAFLPDRLFSLGSGIVGKNCPPYRMIGEAFNAYITVESGGKVLIIDKHAAHERALFEQMKSINRSSRGAGQILMIPLEIDLSADEYDALAGYSEQLTEIGFKVEPSELPRTLLITQIPSMLSASESRDMLISIAGALFSGTGNIDVTKESFFEKALYQASCKAATKAGFIDTPETLRWIVECVLTNPDIRYCPHGRPVAVEITKGEIEKIFKRI